MSSTQPASKQQKLVLLAVGVLIGAVAATCGIGGGLFAVPLLHYGLRLPLKSAVATSLCLVLATSSSATAVEFLHPRGALEPALIGTLIAGALVGAQAGHALVTRLPVRWLKGIFSLVLFVAGLRLLIASSSRGAGVETALNFDPTLVVYAWVLGIGTLAGIAVPLLGVGGGLVVVPSLLFLVPELGYLGARASSLGMATVISARSLVLYRGSGLIDRQRATWFALGALLGALLGVVWVHGEGHASLARSILGLVLQVSATRFFSDAFVRRGALEQADGALTEPDVVDVVNVVDESLDLKDDAGL